MITEIRLENFKSFRELTKIPLKKITVFIGPNGSGKSTPLQALMLLKQSGGDPGMVSTRGVFVDLGGNSNLVFAGSTQPFYTIGLTLKGNTSQGASPGDDSLELEMDVRVRADAHIEDPQEYNRLRSERNGILEKLYYLREWRGFQQANIRISGVDTDDVSRNVPDDDVPSLVAANLGHHTKLRKVISDWAERITGARFDYALASSGAIGQNWQHVLSQLPNEETINIVNEGFGSNQLVQLLVQLALCPQGSFLAIEEPEAHLHPKAQVALVKVLLERAKEHDLQLVLVTHSEHVLHAILNQVAKGSLTPKEAGILYFHKDEGVSHVEELSINRQGMVKGGLPGFFEAELEQFSEFVEALSKRK